MALQIGRLSEIQFLELGEKFQLVKGGGAIYCYLGDKTPPPRSKGGFRAWYYETCTQPTMQYSTIRPRTEVLVLSEAELAELNMLELKLDARARSKEERLTPKKRKGVLETSAFQRLKVAPSVGRASNNLEPVSAIPPLVRSREEQARLDARKGGEL